MDRRVVGVILIGIAAMLYSAYYITLGLMSSRLLVLDTQSYADLQALLGNRLVVASALALVIGLVYLIYEEFVLMNKK